MNEEERAERFARALDDFLSGGTDTPPPSLDSQDLSSLFDVASRRRNRSDRVRGQAQEYESEVWENLLDRLSADAGDQANPNVGPDPDPDSREMMDVISMRRTISEDALALAEQHREDVWEKVRERLAEDNDKRPPVIVSQGDAIPGYESGDAEFDSLVRIALSSTHSPPRDPKMTVRLWSRVGGFPDHSELEKSLEERWGKTSIPASITAKALGIAAGAALLIAAVGPLPTTGFANHPFVQGATHLAGETGIIEVGDAPSVPGISTVDEGNAVTTAEAASLLGLSTAEPAYLPAGMALAGSTYHETGITSPDGGVYSLLYNRAADDASLVIYQESATGPSLVARIGSTINTVVDGRPAAYFEGGWRSEGSALTWTDGESQTLVFEPNGLRVLIQYSGPQVNAIELLSVADSMNFD
jgi:hypothetical protein